MGKIKVLFARLCPTLWDSMDCSPPDSFVHGILQVKDSGGLPFLSRDLPTGIEIGSPEYGQIQHRLSCIESEA